MTKMQLFDKNKKGFTIVELIVVIVVIAILAGIIIVSYGSWRQSIAENNVKSDLTQLAAAMDSAKAWANGYPILGAGADFSSDPTASKVFKPSNDVIVTYGDGDSKNYCVDASSKKVPSAYFFLRVVNGVVGEPKKGSCVGGEGAMPGPNGPEWTLFVYDLNQTGCALTVQLPITSPTSAAGKIIDWGDGSTDSFSSLASHTYVSKGVKTVAYNGPITTVDAIGVNLANRGCLRELRQWGSSAFPTKVSFSSSKNIVKVAQPPSSVADMSSMFSGATSFNQPIGSWDTANVTNMSYMFSGATSFNQPIGSWNTSNVTSIGFMFGGASSFNQPLNSWSTGKITMMSGAFSGATSFNQPLNSWNVSKVTTTALMFSNAVSFNQPLNLWNTSSVKSMSDMFSGATSFNQPIGSWNTGNVISMYYMFSNAVAFNQPIGSWDTSKVGDMRYMFNNAKAFNVDLSSWNVSAVTSKPPVAFATGATAWTLPKPVW